MLILLDMYEGLSAVLKIYPLSFHHCLFKNRRYSISRWRETIYFKPINQVFISLKFDNNKNMRGFFTGFVGLFAQGLMGMNKLFSRRCTQDPSSGSVSGIIHYQYFD